MAVPVAVDDFLAGFVDGARHLVVEKSETPVGTSRRLLDHRQRADQMRIVAQTDTGDIEVLHRAKGLDSVACIVGNIPIAQQIMFLPNRAGTVDLFPPDPPVGGILHPPDDDLGDVRQQLVQGARLFTQRRQHCSHVEPEDLGPTPREHRSGVTGWIHQGRLTDTLTRAEQDPGPRTDALPDADLEMTVDHHVEVFARGSLLEEHLAVPENLGHSELGEERHRACIQILKKLTAIKHADIRVQFDPSQSVFQDLRASLSAKPGPGQALIQRSSGRNDGPGPRGGAK